MARPVIPTAPPQDEGYSSGSPPTTTASTRGVTRPHSMSPFLRSVKRRTEQEEADLEAVTSLLDFSSRGRREPRPPTPGPQLTVSSFLIEETSGSSTATTSVMVRTFSASPPATPAAAPRPDHPPPVISGRRHSGHLVRPRPLRRNLQEEEERLRGMSHTCHTCSRPNSAASAALGAPPGQEEEESLELSDMAETPASPATSDITVIRLVENFLGKIIF